MEPDKRNGGCGVIFNDKLYVWGGQTLDVEQPDAELELEEDDEPLEAVEVVTSLPRPDDVNHPFDVLDLSRMVWSQVTTSARHADKEKYEIPNLGLGSSLLLDPEAECFLLFGGFNELQFDAKVYRIFPGVWEWDVIEPSSDITPTPRYLAGVLIHNNRLCVFGGVSGPITDGVDYGATHVPTRDSNGALLDYGWNNEYFEMDLSTKEWKAALHPPGTEAERLRQRPVRPDPIGGFAFVKIDQYRAAMFGGSGSNGRVNEAHLFNLEERKWSTAINSATPDHPWPPPTRFPSLTALVDPELVGQRLCGCGPVLHQRLVLLWGKETSLLVSKETWMLEVQDGSTEFRWRKVMWYTWSFLIYT
jgi:hypothetical protein